MSTERDELAELIWRVEAAGWRPPTPPAHAIESTSQQAVSTIAAQRSNSKQQSRSRLPPVAQMIPIINRLLRRVGVVIVPVPPSAKMLHEHANVSESFHPSRGGRTVEWMRAVAEATK